MICRFFGFAALSLALAFTVPARAAAPMPPTDGEYAALGQQIASWLSTHDLTAFAQSLDSQALMDRVTNGFDLSGKEASDFQVGLLIGLKNGFMRDLGGVKQAHFLRVVQRPGGKRALVRIHLKGGAINYLEFICTRQTSGELKWIDAFIYTSGDTLSNTLRAAALPMIAEMKKGLLDRLTDSESSYVKHLPEMESAMSLFRNGKAAEAESVLNALPREVQTNHLVLVIRLQVAQAVGNSDYLKVIQDWGKAYPIDPALALISIDGDILRKDFAAAIAHVDQLDRMVGGDPYQNFIRGNIYFAAKNYPMAKQSANAALQADPRLAAAYDVLLNTSLAEGNFDETANILERFERVYPRTDMAKAIKNSPVYAKFLLSPAYARWVEQRSHPAPSVY
jgi:tetratricopeptide (TPR) repeat protein